MSENILVPVTQQQQYFVPETSKPLVLSNLTKRFFTFPKRSILVKPVPNNFIITTQPQKILHQPLLVPNTKKNYKNRCKTFCKSFNSCCKKVN